MAELNYDPNTQMKDPVTGQVFAKPTPPVPSVITTAPAQTQTKNNLDYLGQFNLESAPTGISPITATSANPQIQNTINTINEMVGKLGKSLSEPITTSVSNINQLSAQEKQASINAQNYSQTNDYQKLNDEIQHLKSLRTQRDTELTNLYSQLQPLRQKYIEALTPTPAETDLGTQLIDIRKKQADFELSLEQGQQQQFGLGRPLALSTGRANELLRQGQFTRQDMRNQETLLLNRLGLAQEARKIQLEAYKTGLDFLGEDINFQMKIQDQLRTEENDLLDRIKDFDTNQRQTFATILESLQGSNPDTLAPEGQNQLAQISANIGIPFGVIYEGLKTSFNQASADLLYKQRKDTSVIEVGGRKLLVDNQTGETLKDLGVIKEEPFPITGVVGTPVEQKQVLNTTIKQLPAGQQEGAYGAIASFKNGQDIINLLNQGVATGWIIGKGQKVGQMIGTDNPLFDRIQAAMTSFAANYIKGISGVAVSEQEYKRLMKALPNVDKQENVNRNTIKELLKTIQNKYETQLNINFSDFPDEIPLIGGSSKGSENDPLGLR